MKNLKKYRIAAGMTQQQLADTVGVVRTHISTMERGRFTASVPLAHAIGKALKIDWWLLFDEGD